MSPQLGELITDNTSGATRGKLRQEPWNKGKIIGQKAPLKLKDIWALRLRLQWLTASGS